MQEIDVWDTAGQEAFNILRAMAYPSSNVIVLAFCMGSKDSLSNIPFWVEEVRQTLGAFDSWILVGTKADLTVLPEQIRPNHAEVVTKEDCYKVRLSVALTAHTGCADAVVGADGRTDRGQRPHLHFCQDRPRYRGKLCIAVQLD